MKSFRQHLIEANPMRDAQYRGEAANVWARLLRSLQNNFDNIAKIVSNYSTNRDPRVVINDLGDAIGDAKYKRLRIIFYGSGSQGKLRGQFGFDPLYKNIPVIGIFGIDPGSMKDKDTFLDALNQFRAKYSSTFTHEFIHYSDWKRLGDDKWTEGIRDLDDPYGMTAQTYYNNPIEYNAHFQQGLANLEQDVGDILFYGPKTTEQTKLKVAIERGFSEFEIVARSYFSGAFVDQLTPVNRKKYLARLYQFWEKEIKKSR